MILDIARRYGAGSAQVGPVRSRLAAGLFALAAAAAVTMVAPGAAAQSAAQSGAQTAAQSATQAAPTDFDYTFEMPGQPTLQHVHAAVHMDSSGKLTATIDYLNRDELSPFCGGLVVGVYSADGELLQVFTTPIRCTPAMGANGKNPGVPWQRHFTWSAVLRSEYVPRAGILDVRAVATGNVKVITDEQAREALEKRATVVSSY